MKRMFLTCIVMTLVLSTLSLNVFGESSNWFEFEDGVITSYSYSAPQRAVIPKEINGEQVIKIGKDSFKNRSIASIQIPDSVIEIGDYAFNNNSLDKLLIPQSVKKIGSDAFSNNSLETVTIPYGVEEIGSNAFNNNGLETLVIPNGVKKIGKSAFYNNNLKSLKLSYNIEYIEDNAFRGNNLKEVTLSSRTTFSKNSFDSDVKIIIIEDDRVEVTPTNDSNFSQIKEAKEEDIIKGTIVFAGQELEVEYVKNQLLFFSEDGVSFNEVKEMLKNMMEL